MQFEEFDNRIRQAADQHHPSYDEKAWAKMEKLLDHELPQKDDRRRRLLVIFLLLAVLLGGGIWLLVESPWSSTRISGSTQTNSTTGKSAGTNNDQPASAPATIDGTANTNRGASTAQDGTDTKSNPPVAGSKTTGDVVISVEQPGVTQRRSSSSRPNRATTSATDMDVQVSGGETGKRKQDKSNAVVISNSEKQEVIVSGNAINSKLKPGDKPVKEEADTGTVAEKGDNDRNKVTSRPETDVVTNPKNTAVKKDSAATTAKAPEQKPVTKPGSTKKKNIISFSLSAGPDMSFVSINKPGKVRMVAGAGAGYTINDRWTIRTGFYAANKVYDASLDDYKPADPVQNPQWIEKIAAKCKVYEIPLTVAYNFGRSPKYRTFLSAGLSSFIMKRENYVYWYNYNGTRFDYPHNIENKNRHYFSVLSLSAGYQRKLSNMLSVAVEPYMKLPLSGVGYGKVKLNSAGVLFSLNITPFQ